jgi:hypothetical protein
MLQTRTPRLPEARRWHVVRSAHPRELLEEDPEKEDVMSGMQIFGIVLMVYSVACLVIAGLKPPIIWNTKKIQGFVGVFGELGTMIFVGVWGLIAGGAGVWMLVTM